MKKTTIITVGKMLAKNHPVKHLKKINGITCCPKCGAITLPIRHSKTCTSERFIRQCGNGHIFGTRKVLAVEKCHGDVFSLKELIRKVKAKYEN